MNSKNMYKIVSSSLMNKCFSVVQILLLILPTIISIADTKVANATLLQNDTQGYLSIDFNGNAQGVAPVGPLRDSVILDTTAGVIKRDPTKPNGYFYTTDISPSSFTNWTVAKVTGTYNNLNDIKLSAYTCGASPSAIAAIQNVAINGSGQVDLSPLTNTNSCIRLRVDFDSNGSITPSITDLRVEWQPLPVFLISESGPTSVLAGENITYSINYSLSYVDDSGVVVWGALPTVSNGGVNNYNASYGQDTSLSFVSASNGGQYTASGQTVNGIAIPAGSVYWQLGSLTAGQSGTLTMTLKTQNGLEDGITYSSNAHIDSLAGDEKVSDTNPSLSGSQPTDTIVHSTPAPAISKESSGVVRLGSTNYVYNGSGYTPIVTYKLKNPSSGASNSFAPTGRETIFNPHYEDDISDIVNKLTTQCGVGSVSSVLNINDGGSFDGVSRIVWPVASNIAPGSNYEVSYTVDYSGCPDGMTANNSGFLYSSNTSPVSDVETVTIGLDTNPSTDFAKGDTVFGGQSIINGQDDNPAKVQPAGDVFDYNLFANNSGTVRIGGVTLIDKIDTGLEFVSAAPPSGVSVEFYYNTNGAATAPDTPEDYDPATGVFGPSWSTSTPATSSDVVWVAARIQCLNSAIFPTPAGESCAGASSFVNVPIKVKIKPALDVCTPYDIYNFGNYYTYSAASGISNLDSDVSDLPSPLYSTDEELTHVGPTLGSFENGGMLISSDDSVEAGQNITYTISLTNTGNDTAINTNVEIPIPEILSNGVLTKLSYINAIGGSVNTSGLPNTVEVSLGTIPMGQSKQVQITLGVPQGVKNNETYKLMPIVTAEDDNACAAITSTKDKTTSVISRSKVLVYKERDESIIPSGDAIHYKISYSNVGTAPTTDTYVVDRIPDYTVLDKAYTTGTDSNGNTYNCVGCSVLFSQNIPYLPPSVSPFTAIDVPTINANFTPGTQISPGVWTSPFGVSTRWVAYKIDNGTIVPPLNPTGGTGNVGLSVINDDDMAGPSASGSPSGTMIRNTEAILSSELLQAVGNQVVTTVLPDPGLKLNKTSSKDDLVAGESFNWYIDYTNDSGNLDTSVKLNDLLPVGVTLNGVYNTWNEKAVLNGATPGTTTETNLSSSIYATTTVNVNGTQNIEVDITGLRGGDLENLEGGRMRIDVTVLPTITSGTVLMNTVEGCYANPVGAYCITDDDPVTVTNPDLYIVKSVDKTDPLPGENLSYTLNISNKGAHYAEGVVIKDMLPVDVCYVSGSTVVVSPSGWTLPEPTVSGSCATGQTLEWNSNIVGPSTSTPGYIQGHSPDIYIRYTTLVQNTVQSGVTLINGASISNNFVEDDNYSNNDSQPVSTPYPDPYIIKTGSTIVDPGENITYTLNYGNAARIAATGTYFIDTLPDYDGDNNADALFVSAAGSHGESFYYHAGPMSSTSPAFDYNNPLSNGWTSSPVSPVAYVAVSIGNLAANAGPYSVQIVAKAKNSVTQVNLTPGTKVVNSVNIYSLSTDATTTNNFSVATTTVPSLDLSITKTGSVEGAFPGIYPGANIEYTIDVFNSGTVDACGVYVSDMLPVGTSPISPIHSFNTLSGQIVDSVSGLTVKAHDPLGNDINTAISTTFIQTGNSLRWNLGSVGTTPYTNVCLPPKAKVEFKVFAQIDTSVIDNSTISNAIYVGEDGAATEDLMSNNWATSSVTVYRSDLTISKNGTSYGPDNTLGTADDNQTYVNPGETINYKIEYNNTGNYSASSTVITETVPQGTCYVNGSVAIPGGAVLQLSNTNAADWTYASPATLGATDCLVTNFRLVFSAALPAPATFDSEDVDAEFLAADPAKTGNTNVLVQDDSVSMSGSTSAGLSVPYTYNYSIPTTTWTATAMTPSCWDTGVSPHPICSIDDLTKVDDDISWASDSFILMNDLDMTGVTWNPLFNGMGYEFSGDFNGGNRKISNLSDFVVYANDTGLFGLSNGGHIHNLTLDNITMSNTSSSVGALVAYAKDTHIENIRLENSNILGADAVGGVVGKYENTTGSGEMNEIFVSNTNVALTPGTKFVGGLAGYITGPGSALIIKNVYVDGGQVQGYDLVGGMIGGTDSAVLLEGSYTSNTVVSEGSGVGFGGLVGRTGPGVQIANSYSSSNINLDNGGQSTGGLVGNVGGGDSVINSSYFNGTISGVALGNPSYQTGGLVGLLKYGSASYNINNSYADTSITLSSGSADTGGLVGNIADSNFRSDGSISIGSVSGGDSIGGIVGYMSGTGSTFKGVETSMTVNGGSQVGGFAGVMDNNSRITYGGAMGDVTASGDIVGGFVGVIAGTSYIDQAYAKGNVISTGGNTIGGFVGLMKNENNRISYAHADGNVTADNTMSGYGQEVGGFVGRTMGEIHQAYAKGSVTGSDFVGGFAGSLEDNGSVIAREFSTYALNIGGVHSATGAGGCNGWHTGLAVNGARVEGYGYNMTTGDPTGPFGDIANGCINIVPLDDYAYSNVPESQFYSSGEAFYSNPTDSWNINGGVWQNDGDTVLPYFSWETKSSSGITGTSYYYATVYANPVGFLGWDKLFVNSTVPAPGSLTDATVEVLTPDCTTTLFLSPVSLTSSGYMWQPNNAGGIDGYNELCIKFTMKSLDTITSPSIDGWKFSYKSSQNPSFTWDAQVQNNALLPSQINNTVNINTVTPESNYANNTANDTLYLIQADTELHKYVDKAAMDITEVLNGDQLTYTIVVNNNGPANAEGVYVIDQLPANINLPLVSITTDVTSGVLKCSVDSLAYVMYCDNDGLDTSGSTYSMSITDTATITVVATVSTAVSAGDTVTNNAKVYSKTFDTDTDNNEQGVDTVIGGFANVYVNKTGPVRAGVNKDYTWTINFGNNGNIDAANARIIDKLPNEDVNNNGILDPGEDIIVNGVIDKLYTFVSGSGTLPSVSNCNVLSDTATTTYIICNATGDPLDTSWALAHGSIGSITLTAHAINDYALLNSGMSTNRVSIITDTDETNIADNNAVYTVPFWPSGYSSISGYVYYDKNTDNIRSATETPIANINVFLVGRDSAGHFILPSATASPIEYARGVAIITAMGYVVSTTSTLTLSPVVTSAAGDYNFSGLLPGRYTVIEQQSNAYASVGSNAGYSNLDGSGNPVYDPANDGQGSSENSLISKDEIQNIILAENQNSNENNFAEVGGSVGDQLFKDLNENGIYDATDTPIAGFIVELIHDSNSNGIVDASEMVSIAMTNASGTYAFESLSLGDYIVRVNPAASTTIYNMGLTYSPSSSNTLDGYSKNVSGLPITISTSTTSVMYADFGYKPTHPNLTITKSAAVAVLPGTNLSYNIIVTNSATNSGLLIPGDIITVTDSLPNYLSAVSASGAGWSCSILAPTTTCTYNVVATTTTSTALPAITLNTNVSFAATGTITNYASVLTSREYASTTSDNLASTTTSVTPIELGAVGDRVFIDSNVNGVYDATDSGFGGLLITLYTDANLNGIIDAGDTVFGTTTTDISGQYLFNYLPIQSYIVKYATATIASIGAVELLGPSASADGSAKANAYPVIISTSSPATQINLTADFGVYLLPDLSITKVGSVATALPGSNIDFLITSSVKGGAAVHGPASTTITIVDNMPANMSYISSTSTDWNCVSATSTQVSCSYVGVYPVLAGTTLPPITITAQILPSTPTSVLVNSASIATLGESTTTLADNSSSFSVSVSVPSVVPCTLGCLCDSTCSAPPCGLLGCGPYTPPATSTPTYTAPTTTPSTSTTTIIKTLKKKLAKTDSTAQNNILLFAAIAISLFAVYNIGSRKGLRKASK